MDPEYLPNFCPPDSVHTTKTMLMATVSHIKDNKEICSDALDEGYLIQLDKRASKVRMETSCLNQQWKQFI